MMVPVLLALVALRAPQVAAYDETDVVDLKMEAPLEASKCEGTPATITLLGLTIEVSKAKMKVGSEMAGGTCADRALANWWKWSWPAILPMRQADSSWR